MARPASAGCSSRSRCPPSMTRSWALGTGDAAGEDPAVAQRYQRVVRPRQNEHREIRPRAASACSTSAGAWRMLGVRRRRS
jgi:hypothetical protein